MTLRTTRYVASSMGLLLVAGIARASGEQLSWQDWIRHSVLIARVRVTNVKERHYTAKNTAYDCGLLVTARVLESIKGNQGDVQFLVRHRDQFPPVVPGEEAFVVGTKVPAKVAASLRSSASRASEATRMERECWLDSVVVREDNLMPFVDGTRNEPPRIELRRGGVFVSEYFPKERRSKNGQEVVEWLQVKKIFEAAVHSAR